MAHEGAFVTLIAGLLGACGGDLPSFPPLPRDAGVECVADDAGGSQGCAAGEVCLAGRCYARCTGDDACLPSEQCVEGACRPRTTPRPDMGFVDLGPPDPCAGVECTDPTPVCNPRSRTCVDCRDRTGCPSLAAPVCDLARGVCRAFVAAPCGPCESDIDCAGLGAGARCLTRDGSHATEPLERVCVTACTDSSMCPQGMQCDEGRVCLPRRGTCTTFFAAAQNRACADDADCAPLGATIDDFLWPGACRAGTCRQPCAMAAECPVAGQSCDTSGFCVGP